MIGLAMGDQSGATRVRLYAGPKELDVLNSVRAMGPDGKPTGQSLQPLIQYGWWTIIAKPLYLALRYLREMLGPGAYNWGWAIIIVTVIFNLVMLPTRFMDDEVIAEDDADSAEGGGSQEALRTSQGERPKRAEMNAEMMQLYKTEGVNMYGGCLPLLLQMPLFFAYYRVLLNAVELRQAHWFWLTDLSIARSAARFADSDHPEHVPGAVHYAIAGHGSDAAPHDGDHDAGYHGLHALALCFGSGALLGDGQHDQPGNPGGDQPIEDRQGDARDRRTSRRKETGAASQRPEGDSGAAVRFQGVTLQPCAERSCQRLFDGRMGKLESGGLQSWREAARVLAEERFVGHLAEGESYREGRHRQKCGPCAVAGQERA